VRCFGNDWGDLMMIFEVFEGDLENFIFMLETSKKKFLKIKNFNICFIFYLQNIIRFPHFPT
jgi:hypothetical protein